MAVVIDASVNGVASNSFLTLVEAQAYFDTRFPLPEWDDADSQEALLIMATRLMSAMFSPQRRLVRVSPPGQSYYLIPPTWTGTVATTTQALPWGRNGMYDRNGNAILPTVIPLDLKYATAELAGQLAKGDRTLDSDASVQGIKSIQAGSVAVSFKDMFDATKIIPDIVFSLLVPSWLTDEIMEQANQALFDVVS